MENEPLTSTVQCSHRVAVMGAAGGIGQPMSLLLKRSSLVSQLALYDIVATPGVAADLSHIETRSQVRCPRQYGVYTGTCREGTVPSIRCNHSEIIAVVLQCFLA